eukprot:GHVU01220269.1.p1 GENE.GHVU01220269.1~~GHVU01220269.1.p1  ORF type:complete len:162 (-),score=24.04 GHVU01220269.1:38-523(-)
MPRTGRHVRSPRRPVPTRLAGRQAKAGSVSSGPYLPTHAYTYICGFLPTGRVRAAVEGEEPLASSSITIASSSHKHLYRIPVAAAAAAAAPRIERGRRPNALLQQRQQRQSLTLTRSLSQSLIAACGHRRLSAAVHACSSTDLFNGTRNYYYYCYYDYDYD